MIASDAEPGTIRRTHRLRFSRHVQQHESSEQSRTRAERWFAAAIDSWEVDGRLTVQEAETLRAEITEPRFMAVLPHFGVHLAIGAVLRFPFGSIVRVSYVLLNLLLATLRLLVRDIDRHVWRQLAGIHSPLVLLIAGMPGIGTFAYLASRPMRSNPLLLRVGADAVLMKLPMRAYERVGLRWIIARPRDIADRDSQASHPPLRLVVWAQSIVLIQVLIVGGLFAADLATQVIAELGVVDPKALGVRQALRMLDLGAETSFGTWYQVIALVFLSVLLAIIALATRQQGGRYTRHWFALALLALGFSIDEQVQLHDTGGGTEVLREDLGLSGPIFYGWVMVGALSVLTVGFLYRRFVAHLPQTTRRLYILAGGLYVAGEIVAESVSGWYADVSGGQSDLIYQTLTSFEEFFGMAGILVAIAATLHYIQAHVGQVTVSLSGALPEEAGLRAADTGARHE